MDKPVKEYNSSTYPNGYWCCKIKGEYHREDGPAVTYESGSKFWYLNGKRHRVDGPACEYADGDKSWWLNGKEYAEQEYKVIMRQKKLKKILNEQTS